MRIADCGISSKLKARKVIGSLISYCEKEIGGQVLLFDILISRDKRRCSSDLIIDFGLTRNEIRYILDPKDAYASDFPGEAIRFLKEKRHEKVEKNWRKIETSSYGFRNSRALAA